MNTDPSQDTMKIHSKQLKEEKWESPTEQLSYTMYGDPGLIMNFSMYVIVKVMTVGRVG